MADQSKEVIELATRLIQALRNEEVPRDAGSDSPSEDLVFEFKFAPPKLVNLHREANSLPPRCLCQCGSRAGSGAGRPD
jgi:hypothetical protein